MRILGRFEGGEGVYESTGLSDIYLHPDISLLTVPGIWPLRHRGPHNTFSCRPALHLDQPSRLIQDVSKEDQITYRELIGFEELVKSTCIADSSLTFVEVSV